MSQTVIQYVLSRLKNLGVTDVFGIPGDFVYPVCDAIIDDPDIRWIGCSNELNASYAADGYARTKGVGVVVSTYGAGELCTLGGLAGAHAESSKVVSLAGMPGRNEQAGGYRTHHQIADQPPAYDLFKKMAEHVTVGAAVITPENCVTETERLIAAMLYHSKPIYMVFPRDVPHLPVVISGGDVKTPLANPQSNPDALNATVADIAARLSEAKQACILPGYLLRRYGCVEQAKALINASGLPFATGFQDKGIIAEDHPSFMGGYLGRMEGLADEAVTRFVESSDCIIGLGPENHEFNNAFHTMKYDFKTTINIMPHKTRVGMATYEQVEMKDVLEALTKRMSKRGGPQAPKYGDFFGEPTGDGADKITAGAELFSRFNRFMKPNDIFIMDVGIVPVGGGTKMTLPAGVDVEGQSSWGAIGWGTAACIGVCTAARGRRVVVIAGEGGHQMTANDLGTLGRYGLKPIIFVVNNNGYLGERVTNRNPDEEYNDVAPWNYTELPSALGCKNWFTATVRTLDELDAAMKEASKGDRACYIEVITDTYALAPGCEWFFAATGPLFGRKGRTWEGWLKEMKAKRKS